MITSAPLTTEFTILVDSQEKHPFRFTGLSTDSHKNYRPLHVQFRWEALGKSKGDYSIDGHQPNQAKNVDPSAPRVSVERKSIEDCIGTVIDFRERRERFERELETLASIDSACVIVEGTMHAVMAAVEQHGKKTREENIKTLYRSWIAFQQDYRGVPWFFCDDRRLAEITCFRWLERFWRKQAKPWAKTFSQFSINPTQRSSHHGNNNDAKSDREAKRSSDHGTPQGHRRHQG
jgi:hypothetical protein